MGLLETRCCPYKRDVVRFVNKQLQEVQVARYVVAVNAVVGRQLLAAAVIYTREMPEPSFTYLLHGSKRTSFLYRRGDKVPTVLDAALNEHIRSTAASWALVTAHPQCALETALELAVIRAVERFVCRQDVLPSLEDMCVAIPTLKFLENLPPTLKQFTHIRDWRIAAARALCRYQLNQETGWKFNGTKRLSTG